VGSGDGEVEQDGAIDRSKRMRNCQGSATAQRQRGV
jgi:hypothetical protein